MIKKSKDFLLKRLSIDPQTIEFFAHSKNYLKANLVVKALSLISVPIFTSLLLPEAYGMLSIFQVLSGIIMVIMSVGLSGGIYRRFFEKETDFPEFLGSNLLFLVCFSGVVMATAVAFAPQLSEALKIPPLLVPLASVAAFFIVVFNIHMRLLQAKNQSKKYSKMVILQAVGLLMISVPLILAFPKETNYMGSIYAMILTGGAFFAYASYKLAKESKFVPRFKYVKYSLMFGLPLIPNAFSGYLLAYFDKIIVGQLTTLADAGIYNLGFNLGMTLTIVIVSITNAWSPRFFSQMAEKKSKEIELLARKATKIVLMAALAIIVFSSDFINIFTSAAYHGSALVVPAIVFGYTFFFFYSLYQLYSEYRKKTIFVSVNNVVALAVNIALNYALIPAYGYLAAAYTSMASFAVMFLLHYLTVKYVLKEKDAIRLRVLMAPFAIFTLLALAYLFAESMAGNIALQISLKAIVLVALAAIFFGGTMKKFARKSRQAV